MMLRHNHKVNKSSMYLSGNFPSMHLNPIKHFWDAVEWEIHSMNVQLNKRIRCYHVNMTQNLKGMFSTSSEIHAMKN